jgi:hypothetical protein
LPAIAGTSESWLFWQARRDAEARAEVARAELAKAIHTEQQLRAEAE